MTRYLHLATWLAATLLAACGGADGPAAEPVLRDARTLSAAGGTLAIDAATLTLPPRALAANTELVLEALSTDPAVGEPLRLRLSPAGQPLAQPARLVLTVPGAAAGLQPFWVLGDELVLAPARRSGDRFELLLDSLAYTAEGRLRSLAAPRVQALAAPQQRPLSDPAGGGELSMRVLNCQTKVQMLERRLARLAGSGATEEALLLAPALQDLRIQCSQAQQQQIQAQACSRLQAVLQSASAALPVTLGELNAVIREVMGAAGAVQLAGAACAPEPDVDGVVASRMRGYIAVLTGQVRRGEIGDDAGARELSALFAIEGDCQRLELDEACALLGQTLYPEILDAMREAAFDECRQQGSALVVSQFLDLSVATGRDGPFLDRARFRVAEVEADLMQCRSPTLAVRVFDDDGGVPTALPDRDLTLQPMQDFNDYRLAGTVRPPRNGRLVLEGTVPMARCPDGSALRGADLVVRTAAGLAEVARRPHDGSRFTLDRLPIDLSVPELLQRAGQDPAVATATSLIVRQEGGQCESRVIKDAKLLNQPIVLFVLDLQVAPQPPAAEPRWSGSVSVSVDAVARLRGTRTNEERTKAGATARETTSETVDLAFTYGYTLPLPAGSALPAGRTVPLAASSTSAGSATGTATVDSRFEFVSGTCIETVSDRGSLSGRTTSFTAVDNALTLGEDGTLQIRAGGLQGGYTATSSGTLASVRNDGCRNRGSFSRSFDQEGAIGTLLNLGSATLSAPADPAAERLEGSATLERPMFFSTRACDDFVSGHLNPLSRRLLPEEREVQCLQRVTISWQLQRE